MERGIYFDAWYRNEYCYHPSLPMRSVQMLNDLEKYHGTVLVWAGMGGGSISLPFLTHEAFGEVDPRIQIDAGVPGIQLDECELPMTSINSGGCFCDSCMKQFRQWFKDRRPVALTPEGIQRPDIETFRTGDIVTIRLKNAGLYTVIAV